MVGDVEQGGDRGEPDELRLGDADPVLAGQLADGLPGPPHRRHGRVEEVHRDLGPDGGAALRLLDPEPVRLEPRQPAARLAHAPRDPLGEVDVVRVQVDVPRDEERPGADGHGAEPRVHARRPEVGLAAVGADLGLQALVLAPAHVGELDPVGARRRVGVEVDGDPVATGDPGTERPGELDAVVHRRRRPAGRTGSRRRRRSAGARPGGAPCRCRRSTARRAVRGRRSPPRARPATVNTDRLWLASDVRSSRKTPVARRQRRGEPLDHVEPAALGDVGDGFDQHAAMLAVGRPPHRPVRADPAITP